MVTPKFSKKPKKQKKKLLHLADPSKWNRCMGECPTCGSYATARVVAASLNPAADAKSEVLYARLWTPIAHVGTERYRRCQEFGTNAVCTECGGYFRGRKTRVEARFEKEEDSELSDSCHSIG